MPVLLTPETELLPGYRLLEPLGRGGFGEVWKCEAPGGFFKAIKIVSGGDQLDEAGNAFAQERKSLDHIKTIRHPFLLSMDRVELVDGDLVIVMELADKSLRKVLEECQASGLPGIPHNELVGYLLEAAEALDLMNLQHQLLHLDIKPDNLFLVSHHVKVADFGLVKRATNSSYSQSGGMTPLYAAPERFKGTVSPSCDQYSLAIAYQELLTGTLPFAGKNWRQLLLQHCHEEPNLEKVPEEDRPILARALAKEHADRFPSCTDLVQALISGSIEGGKELAQTSSARRSGVIQLPCTKGGTRNLRLPASAATRRPEREDARRDPAPQGVLASPARATPVSREPLQGYEFLDRLGQGPCGEYWRVRAPNGTPRLVQLVYGYPSRPVEEELEALKHLKSLRHTGLAKVEVVFDSPGRFFLIADVPELTLWDRFQQARNQGLSGLPRDELLEHLHTAAETLDDLQEDHRLAHLGLTPRCLLLFNQRLRLSDFGLIHLFWGAGEAPLGPLNARYAAPELFRETVNRSCDVYSLALLFQELLTGTHPQRGQSVRPSPSNKKPGRLDFANLPAHDRRVLTQALDADPATRFQSCVALVEALKGKASTIIERPPTKPLSLVVPVTPQEAPRSAACTQVLEYPPLRPILQELVTAAAGTVKVLEKANFRYLLYPENRIVHKCAAALHADMARLKMEGFRQEWHARVIEGNRPDHFALLVSSGGGFWSRCLGRDPGLEVHVGLRHGGPGMSLTEITVEIRPSGCGSDEGKRLLEDSGPVLLASLRTYLQPYPERRAQARLQFEQTIEVCPILPGGNSLGDPMMCLSRDLSMNGMRLWVPQPVSVRQVCVQLPQVSRPGVIPALAHIRNIQEVPTGGFEIGVRFQDDPAG